MDSGGRLWGVAGGQAQGGSSGMLLQAEKGEPAKAEA